MMHVDKKGLQISVLALLAIAQACTESADLGPTQPVPVASVAVALGTSSLLVGQTTQATATLRDASGNQITGRPVVWTTSNGAVSTVSTNGLITALAPGASTISAAREGQTGTAVVSVSLVPVASVAVTLGTSSLLVGQTTQATATLRDAGGNQITGRPIDWTTSDGTVATVSNSGVVTAVASGTATVRATTEGKVASAAIAIDRVSAIGLAFKPITPGDPSFMVANGSSAVPLAIEVRGANGNVLPITENLHRFANGAEFQGNDFKTTQDGTVRLSVNGYGVQSNELVITARPEEVYSVVRLPIIFHVYTNSARQWTAAWTAQMLQLLNAFYRNTATNSLPNDPNAVDTFIEFYLADKDPQGNTLAVPGVDNLNEVGDVLNAAGDAVGAQYFTQCASHMWNPTKYINVFIANQGAVSPFGRLFAQGKVPVWGGLGATNTNALWPQSFYFVISHDAALYQPRELANVLAHETGHLLSLRHPFSQRTDKSCPSTDPDGLVDTPVYDVLTYTLLFTMVVNGIPVALYDGCAGRAFTEVNIMGYTTYHSKSFTYSQRQRMQYLLAWAYLLPTPINQGR